MHAFSLCAWVFDPIQSKGVRQGSRARRLEGSQKGYDQLASQQKKKNNPNSESPFNVKKPWVLRDAMVFLFMS